MIVILRLINHKTSTEHYECQNRPPTSPFKFIVLTPLFSLFIVLIPFLSLPSLFFPPSLPPPSSSQITRFTYREYHMYAKRLVYYQFKTNWMMKCSLRTVKCEYLWVPGCNAHIRGYIRPSL